MVLLYMRGLLKPDYPHGVKSVAREEMLLLALSLELAANSQLHNLMVQAAFAPLIDPRKANVVARNMSEYAEKISKLAGLDIAKKPSHPWGSVKSMSALYHALVKQGIIIENSDNAT